MASRGQTLLALAALLACSLGLTQAAALIRGPAKKEAGPAAVVAAEEVASNWLCMPSSGAMCKALPGNVFQVSNYNLSRGGALGLRRPSLPLLLCPYC